MKNPEAVPPAEPPAATVLDVTGARREDGETEAAEDLSAIDPDQLEAETNGEVDETDGEADTEASGKGDRKGTGSKRQ
jgi:hypothetical protein